jgi:hypothetical protein
MNKTAIALILFAALATELPAAPAEEWTDILPLENLNGWTRVPIPPVGGSGDKLQWRVVAGSKTLICTGDGAHEWLRYDRELGNYVLSVEWRFTPREGVKYNSGIGVRLSKYGEIWHQAQTGPSGGFLFGEDLIDGAIRRFNLRDQMKENRVKPAGEWNTYEIRADGGNITLSVNGEVVSQFTGAALRRGYIGLEAEGAEITFRNLKLRELP